MMVNEELSWIVSIDVFQVCGNEPKNGRIKATSAILDNASGETRDRIAADWGKIRRKKT